MGRLCDLKGQRFSNLTVLEFAGLGKQKNAIWKCLCDCGKETNVAGRHLKNGHTKSCGCLSIEKFMERITTHNGTYSRLYNIWTMMKDRCYREKSTKYRCYGAKGVIVCEEWKHSFETFRTWALENGYREDLTIDRVDACGDYTPTNCRWITNLEQQKNKRNTVFINLGGEVKALQDWADHFGFNRATIAGRYRKGDRGERLFRAPM